MTSDTPDCVIREASYGMLGWIASVAIIAATCSGGPWLVVGVLGITWSAWKFTTAINFEAARQMNRWKADQ